MKYSDKEISGECQACEPETVYAAAADRQQDFSHLYADQSPLRTLSVEEWEACVSLDDLKAEVLQMIDNHYHPKA